MCPYKVFIMNLSLAGNNKLYTSSKFRQPVCLTVLNSSRVTFRRSWGLPRAGDGVLAFSGRAKPSFQQLSQASNTWNACDLTHTGKQIPLIVKFLILLYEGIFVYLGQILNAKAREVVAGSQQLRMVWRLRRTAAKTEEKLTFLVERRHHGCKIRVSFHFWYVRVL